MRERIPLSFFADPYRDELFYSCLARNKHYFPGISTGFINYLTGTSSLSVNLFTVNNLNNILEVLSGSYSGEDIINNHTILPYYFPFLTEKRKEHLLSRLNGEGGTTQILGIYRKNFGRDPFVLKYCFGCLVNDLNHYGTACFHTYNMIPGLDICPYHHYYLSDYPGRVDEFIENLVYPDKDLMTAEPIKCNCPHELKLAESFLQVRKHQEVTGEEIRELYFNVLYSHGYCRGSRVDYKRLYRDFQAYYGEDYLKQKNCLIEEADIEKSWFVFYRKNRREGIVQPYRFLLLVNFLCGDFENFLKEGRKGLGVLKKSWVCHNPVCPHYHTDEKTEYNIIFDGESSRVVVRCECGMIYSSRFKNPDSFRILQAGNLLYNEIVRLRSEGLSYARIADRLDLKEDKVSSLLDEDPVLIDRRIEKARELLDQLIEEDSEFSRTTLEKSYRSTYYILSTYDWDYFNQKLPAKNRIKNLSSIPPDYKKLDDEYFIKTKKIIEELKSIEPIVKITKTLILKQLGISDKFLKKLPKTLSLIKESRETSFCYNVRKGKRAIDSLINEGLPVTKEVLRSMGVRIYNPEVEKEIFRYYGSLFGEES